MYTVLQNLSVFLGTRGKPGGITPASATIWLDELQGSKLEPPLYY